MAVQTHMGHKFKTRAVEHGFVPYVYLGAPYWWRVNRGIDYTTRFWAEQQAKWAIEEYVAGRKPDLSINPERR